MLYDIRLTIAHRYAGSAGNGRHLLRVLPRQMPGRQRVSAHLVDVTPHPDQRHDSVDFFGNAVTTVTHLEAHSEMSIRMSSRVEITASPGFAGTQLDLAELRGALTEHRALNAASPLHFLGPSPRLRPIADIADFAHMNCDPAAPVAQTVARLGEALHHFMTFDASATTVDTDAAEAFAKQRGVCQDLSHIMILALQSLGIPAGYVSGYLRTLPPPGGVRLEGVDAMHAWVQAWCGPDQGWVEYDPTNATFVGTDHIVVGYGRDYSDVSPVIGYLRSSGKQTNSQSVDVACVD
ncbi:transglutaminase family protein [Sulfitobacter sp.]|uniref:transglutaminase family protein n=1 Tax=Sulfitobacter sp. TaxID=1903071 RepID=UPI003F6C49D7